MLSFITTLQKFASQGDKTGWTIIGGAAEQANKPQSNTKNSFRVKGKLDEYAFEGATLIPTGESDFIKAINVTMRQPIKKRNDDTVKVILEFDEKYDSIISCDSRRYFC